jgi:CrcB protein
LRLLVFLALAGAAGSVSRYLMGRWMTRLLGEGFPYGTLVVNVIGCFLLGLLMQLALKSDAISDEWRIPLAVGFLGAFTTFSTFGYDTVRYLSDGAWGLALANVGSNLLVGFVAVWAGLVIARLVVA